MELRDYQAEALAALRQTVGQGVKRVCLMAPTGAGKTHLSAAIATGALAKGKRMAFVVPSINLVNQTLVMFHDLGIRDVGVMQQNHERTDWSKPVQICSIATLAARKLLPDADVAVIDECHIVHHFWTEYWLPHPDWAGKPIIGLSATPWTRGLGRHFQTLQIVATTKDMIEKGVLSSFKVFAVSAPDLSRVKTVAGEYHQGQLSDVMCEEGRLTADIVKTWQEKWGQDKTLCFAVDLAHARQLHARFDGAGVKTAYQDASTPGAEREALRGAFNKGDVQVIVSVGTMTMGVDLDVRCISDCQPTKSEMRHVQKIGRGLRKADGKDFLLLLDHTTNTGRLGFVTDIHYDRLDDGAKKREAKKRDKPLPKPCESCGYIPPIRERVCSNCGHEKPLPTSPHVERDGALVEVTGGARRNGSAQLIPFTVAEKKAFYAELMWVGSERRYKDGWAAVQFREKFGAWPPFSWKTMVLPAEPGALVLSWVKSRMIRYAKARERNG